MSALTPELGATTIATRLAVIRERIGREDVLLVAVSKRHPDAAVREAYAAGQRDFGENLAQALAGRAAGLGDLAQARWHAIGPVQTNKAKLIAQLRPTLLHTIDRVALIEALEHRLAGAPPLDVLIQVNIDREPHKAGCMPEGVDALADRLAASATLTLRGLMCIPRPPATGAPRAAFAATRELAATVADRIDRSDPIDPTGHAWGAPVLSMGMSDDFEDAIAEGSTLVRVGTALFGSR